MPIYEYECPACGTFELIQKFSDDPLTECPHCAKQGNVEKVNRLVSAAAFHLKGSGWYKTDYAGSASGGATAPPAKANDSSSKEETTKTSSEEKSSTSETKKETKTKKADD